MRFGLAAASLVLLALPAVAQPGNYPPPPPYPPPERSCEEMLRVADRITSTNQVAMLGEIDLARKAHSEHDEEACQYHMAKAQALQ